jgi:drug/metabolite transporter (DMT)-like permease
VRVFGAFVTLLLLFLLPRHRQPVPLRWWPVLALQGLLDGGAYLALQVGSRGPDAAVAVVVASTFCVVPVLLARLVLREAIALAQWGGIALVVASVAVLSA